MKNDPFTDEGLNDKAFSKHKAESPPSKAVNPSGGSGGV
jgi:hypothetical protein